MTAISHVPWASVKAPPLFLALCRILAAAGVVRRLAAAQRRSSGVDEFENELDEKAIRLSQACHDLCGAHGIEVGSEGEVPRGAVALVANHLGYIDPLVVIDEIPAIPIAKREVGSWPLLGGLMDGLGVLWVNRECPLSGARVLRGAARVWKNDLPILVFPEGTTTDGKDALPFRRGIFGMAMREGVPIVPVSITYEPPEACWVGNAAFLPHYLGTAARRRTRVRVRFHPPLEGTPGEKAEEAAERARRTIVEALTARRRG